MIINFSSNERQKETSSELISKLKSMTLSLASKYEELNEKMAKLIEDNIKRLNNQITINQSF